MDLSVAVPAVILLSPVMAGASVAVLVSLGRPILFRQTRVGFAEREFRIYKFRTMRPGNPDASPDEDHLRITRLGALLRSTSIDELPQLFNVLKGEMSLVGPRPLLTRYLPRYSPRQRRRQEVMPGLTGWAQIHGRNSVGWDEKLEHDVWYVEHWSPWLDVSIVLRTALKVLQASDVSAEGHATMPEFMGVAQHTSG
ncbi:MAG TPA: sugar transferase [Deltaproteobacteria bacterium]|nr:sugar transferase [Deltaproteobacteria bacterium]